MIRRAASHRSADRSRHAPRAVAAAIEIPTSAGAILTEKSSLPHGATSIGRAATARRACLLPNAHASRRGFTLVELLITVSIIAIMASMVLFAMFQAQDAAKAQKTRTLITKLNNIIMTRYDEYRTRRIPYQFPPPPPSSAPPNVKRDYQRMIGQYRLDCLHDLMRMEMPDRWSDVVDPPAAPFPETVKIERPPISKAYYAKYEAANMLDMDKPSITNQGAECLYMIVMATVAQQGDARTVFKATDIGDTDGDGFPEFLDGWGNPIEFLRWAPGYLSDLQAPIRIKGDLGPAGMSRTLTVTGNEGPRLSQTPGSYVGGALALIDPASQTIDTRSMAKITGYSYDASGLPPTVRFTCEYPSRAVEEPFDNTAPGEHTFVVMQPDPFDSRGVYPDFVNIRKPTYAIYPLIISKGSDRAMGIKDGGGGAALHYAAQHLNPFFVDIPASEPFGLMLGAALRDSDEPLFKPGAHLDNITNHQLNTR